MRLNRVVKFDFTLLLLALFTINLSSCGTNSQQVLEVDLFAHSIHQTRKQIYLAKDSLDFQITSDLKFKEEGRIRRNEVTITIPENKMPQLLAYVKFENEVELNKDLSFSNTNDTIKVLLKMRYIK